MGILTLIHMGILTPEAGAKLLKEMIDTARKNKTLWKNSDTFIDRVNAEWEEELKRIDKQRDV